MEKELKNVERRVARVESSVEMIESGHGERLRALEKELKSLRDTVSLMFVLVLTSVGLGLAALYLVTLQGDEILTLQGQTQDLMAWLTKLTAEVRGIGG